jgi:hypothetical protein
MLYTYLSPGAGTMEQLVADVPSGLGLSLHTMEQKGNNIAYDINSRETLISVHIYQIKLVLSLKRNRIFTIF